MALWITADLIVRCGLDSLDRKCPASHYLVESSLYQTGVLNLLRNTWPVWTIHTALYSNRVTGTVLSD